MLLNQRENWRNRRQRLDYVANVGLHPDEIYKAIAGYVDKRLHFLDLLKDLQNFLNVDVRRLQQFLAQTSV